MESAPDPYIKLNTDGSAIGNPRLVGAGRILRDSSGISWTGNERYKCFTLTMKQMHARMLWRSGELINNTFCLFIAHVPVLYMPVM
ncbi:hypothetical protein ACB092_02G115500 [Castanea dentata]